MVCVWWVGVGGRGRGMSDGGGRGLAFHPPPRTTLSYPILSRQRASSDLSPRAAARLPSPFCPHYALGDDARPCALCLRVPLAFAWQRPPPIHQRQQHPNHRFDLPPRSEGPNGAPPVRADKSRPLLFLYAYAQLTRPPTPLGRATAAKSTALSPSRGHPTRPRAAVSSFELFVRQRIRSSGKKKATAHTKRGFWGTHGGGGAAATTHHAAWGVGVECLSRHAHGPRDECPALCLE